MRRVQGFAQWRMRLLLSREDERGDAMWKTRSQSLHVKHVSSRPKYAFEGGAITDLRVTISLREVLKYFSLFKCFGR